MVSTIIKVLRILYIWYEKTFLLIELLPIEEVEFSVRAYNCLKRAGIHTVQDLVDETRNGGYISIIKLKERRGDDALEVRLELV